jgi:hypothetical protein
VSYRRFLGKSEEIVAPVVNREVWLRDRRLRISSNQTGWQRVKVTGRNVEVVRAATEEEVSEILQKLPAVRGPLVRLGDGWAQVREGGCHPIDLMRLASDEDPPLFAPLRARVWPAGELLLWDELEWEGEAEEAARTALEEGRGLGDVKGASASLRAAFAIALGTETSRALQIPAAPAELRRWLREILEQGRPAAEVALRALAAERALYAAQQRLRPRPVERPVTTGDTFTQRVEESLRGAGARLLAVRRMGGGQLEVRWQFDGTRLISVVQEEGLRVIDSGVCLAGSDDLVTLDALPAVIREAIAESALVITRHEGD